MRRKWVAVVAAVVAALAAGSAGAGAGVGIVVNGEPVRQDVPPFIEGGIVLAEPTAVCEALGARVEWDEASRQLRVERCGTRLALKVGDRRAEVNGEPRVLEVPPVLVGSKVFAPLRFVAESLGAEVRWDAVQSTVHIDLVPAERATITGVSLHKTAAEGLVRIAANAKISFAAQRSGPDEVVVDIQGAAPFSGEERIAFDDQLVSGVVVARTGSQPPAARVAVKLKLPVDCRVEGDDREVRIAFAHQVTSVALEAAQGREVLAVRTTGPVGFTALRYPNPDRVVVDIPGVRLASSFAVAARTSEIVGQVTFQERRDPDGARIVVELKQPAAFQAWTDGDGVRLLFNGVVQDVRAERTGGATRVLLRTTSSPAFSVAKLHDPLRLVVDLPGTNVATAHNVLSFAEGLVRQIHLAELGAGAATVTRVSLLLDYYAGHRVLPPDGNSRDLVVELFEAPLRGKVVVLDPGHGGPEPGAIGKWGLREKDVNLDIALRLRDLLERAGAQVVMTREADVLRPMAERIRIANAAGADMVLSVHTNSFFRAEKRGTETYSYSNHPASGELARTVHSFLSQGLGLPDRGLRRMDFPLLQQVVMPAVLVEPAYLSNDVEAALLRTPSFRATVAEVLQLAIVSFLTGGEVRVDLAGKPAR